MDITNSLLGKNTEYKNQYDANLLFKIPRAAKRLELGIGNILPFYGIDIWNAYELSWLNLKGKPSVAVATIFISAHSEFIVESKSLKLYLNSFNDTKFATQNDIAATITSDLSQLLNTNVKVELIDILENSIHFERMLGQNIDHLDITPTNYNTPSADILQYNDVIVSEELNSNLLKSNCLITNQPDWASIIIKYSGKQLLNTSLLEYIISFRNHNEFHEQCVERIFTDITKAITPEYLSVYARYTRRGGIDICPYRSSKENFTIPANNRLIRQ